jgi:single-stranded-DNA-specific exonuclease
LAFGVARSFSGRRWRLKPGDESLARKLIEDGFSPVLSRLLAARGVEVDAALDYLNPTLKKLMPDPLVLREMDLAVARVTEALEKDERMAVFGDYDVDGSVSAALLSEFFKGLGEAPRIYIPDRMREGYGPSAAAFARLKEEGIRLVITVDCGASGGAAFEAAASLNLDIVVLDHHRVEARPDAFAHVNPNQPGDGAGLGHLCAAGVTFMFLVALNRHLRDSGFYQARGLAGPDLREYLDLVGLATVCDVVPLIGVNRAFVRQGLSHLSRLSRPGLKALADIARAEPPFNAYHLGFVFGPRINAGGRVGRSSLGADLLTARAPEAAAEFATLLDLHNQERRQIEKDILDQAIVLALSQENAPFLLVEGEGWHPGVVGIVAGRLKERFAKPAFVAGFEGGMGRGSARGIAGLDIGRMVRAALETGLIESGGGHAMAAGFSLTAPQIGGFRAFLHAQFEGAGAALDEAAALELDAVSSPSAATPHLVREIALAGPYGAGNAEPLLGIAEVKVGFAGTVGGDHVRLRLVGGDGSRLDAIAFRAAGASLGQGLLASRGKLVHVAGKLRLDNWGGIERAQLEIEDAAPASA